MKIISESAEFSTIHKLHFKGKEEFTSGSLTLSIQAEGVTTPSMATELENLAVEMLERAKEIVAMQEAPQQIFR